MTTRYMLEPSIRVGYTQPSWLDRHRINIPTYDDFSRFVDILEQNEDFIKVVIFLKDGEIITCWLVKRCQFPLELHNEEELYDGRFNSSQMTRN